jgi:hypothetical protein
MSNRRPLTIAEREAIYDQKAADKRLADLAEDLRCSFDCARKWWRVGRKQGRDALHRQRKVPFKGALSHFAPVVSEQALRRKQQHPKRGASRILVDLEQDSLLQDLRLPKQSSLAAFFHEACPELLQHHVPRPKSPPRATHIHDVWELDGKENIRLTDGTIATALDVRAPMACCFLGSFAHAVQTEKAWRKLTLRETQADLRQVFTEFGLPVAIQTDRESGYGQPPENAFPTLFTLWFVGLGLGHRLTRPGQATDQSHVERGHRTLFDWIEEPQPLADLIALQAALRKARYMHNEVLPSDAGDCQGRPPLLVHPEVKVPLRPYAPTVELALFDLKRVDQFLARYAWPHLVTKNGQVTVGENIYYVGIAYAGQTIDVRFDPQDRNLTFHDAKDGHVIRRRPVKGLTVANITGLEEPPPPSNTPIQLSFPL